MPQISRKEKLLLALIVVAGAVLRLLFIPYGIGTHPDERFMVMTTEKLSLSNLNPGSFAYGSLPYYLAFLTSSLVAPLWSGAASYDGLFIVGRVVCAVAGLVTVLATWAIGRRCFESSFLALIAAFLLSFNFFHVQLSRYFTSDIILTTLCTLVLYTLIRLLEDRSNKWAILTGVCCGLAMATKVSAALLVAPVTVALLGIFWSKGASVAAVKFGALIALVSVVAFVVAEPYALLDFDTFRRHTMEQTGMARGLWRPPYTVQYAGTVPYLYHLEQMFKFTVGWPVMLLAAGGLFVQLKRLVTSPRFAELVLISWAGTFFLATAGLQVKFPRYLLPLYPVTVVYAALGLAALSKMVLQAKPSTSANATVSYDLKRSFASLLSNPALPWILPGAALAASFVASLLGSNSGTSGMAFFLWTTSLAALAGMGLLLDYKYERLPLPRLRLPQKAAWIALLLLLTGVLLRTLFLAHFPVRLTYDEAAAGLNLRRLSELAIFQYGPLNFTGVTLYLWDLFFRLFGGDLVALRLSAALFGVLTLIGGFLVTRRLFSMRAALYFLALAVPYHWLVHASRTGFYFNAAPACTIWAVYGMVSLVRGRSYRSAAFAGIASGVSFALFPVESTTLLIVFALCSVPYWKRIGWKRPSIFGASLFCAALPVLLLVLQSSHVKLYPTSFYLFSADHQRHLTSLIGRYDTWPILRYQIGRIAGFLFRGGDTSLQYGNQFAFFGIWLALLSLVGFVGGLRQKRGRFGAILSLVLFTVLLTVFGVLMIDPPFTPRMIAVAPVLLLLPSAGLAYLSKTRFLAPHRTFPVHPGLVLSIIFVCVFAVSNVVNYFSVYPRANPPQWTDRIAAMLSQFEDIDRIIIVGPPEQTPQPEVLQFASPKAVVTVHPLNELQSLLNSSPTPSTLVISSTPILMTIAPFIQTNRIGRVTWEGGSLNWYMVP